MPSQIASLQAKIFGIVGLTASGRLSSSRKSSQAWRSVRNGSGSESSAIDGLSPLFNDGKASG